MLKTIDRKTYWIAVVILLAAKVGIIVSITAAPSFGQFARYVDTPIVIVLALVIGARFADGGWPRWLGITLAALIMAVLPIVLLIALQPAMRSGNFLDDAPPEMTLVTVALLALVIVAGVRKSVAAPVVERVEPTMS